MYKKKIFSQFLISQYFFDFQATVVWQDGSIEEKIASRELYPIHALDDQEFFPGDFVVRTSINSELGGKVFPYFNTTRN